VLSATVKVMINVMSTTNTVNGKMDSNGSPSAGDLMNMQEGCD
jgi:hypothetical protein